MCSGDRAPRAGLVLAWVRSARRALRRRWASIACESNRDLRPRWTSSRPRLTNSCRLCVTVCEPFRPSVGCAGRKRARTPERSIRRAQRHRVTAPPRWLSYTLAVSTGPAVKPITHASRLVAQIAPSVAFGLGAEESWPQGQLTFDSTPIVGVLCQSASIVCRAHPRARGPADSSQARLVSHAARPRPGIIDRNREPGDRTKRWDIRSSLSSHIAPWCCTRSTRPAQSPSRHLHRPGRSPSLLAPKWRKPAEPPPSRSA